MLIKAAEAERRLVPAPVKIEPPGIRVDLDRDAVLGACAQNFFNVDLVAGPPQQLPPGHMAENGRVRIADRPE